MSEQKLPRDWDVARCRRIIDHYASLTEEEQLAEDEDAARDRPGQTSITVPDELLPAIRQLLAEGRAL